ncbi:helix-turn-helix domain-containing protein [Lentzea sp. HUAS12]|uniref:helix-turn-helix domain-containing protein n=1 Tax=Lentzea sp. HUAS12 TaxID=2951806 RepID=UPI00209F45AE|nr:PucR family transcriptional regulator [Lentzea sp. HUAS12]USX56259.1 helix-turn-helix domain-containing protein [Lentzea sp. HUAS12]
MTARHVAHSMTNAGIEEHDACRLVHTVASTLVNELIADPSGSRLSTIRHAVELMSSTAESVIALHCRFKDAELANRADWSPLSLRLAGYDDPASRATYENNCLYIVAARGELPEEDELYRMLTDVGAGSAVVQSSPEELLAIQRLADRRKAERMCRELLKMLPPSTVMTAEPLVFGGPLESFRTAEGVLRLTAMFDLAPGFYQISDFPVEFAVATTSPVREKLLAMIQPVMVRSDLKRTLELLVVSQGNRTRAAERLKIHRSTIDYRLNQIDRLTGHSPITTVGLNMLAMALAVHTLMT